MQKIFKWILLGSILLVSIQATVFGTESVNMVPTEKDLPIKWTVVTGGIDINASILAIKDPYEQCLAYTKLKNITDVDCKVKVDAIKKKQEQKALAEENDRQKDMKVIVTAWKKPDNTTNWNTPKPSMPPVNIDALMDHYMKAIDASGVQLTADQRTKIMEALRIQFSKVEMASKLKDIKQEAEKEIKEIRQETKKEVKEMRTTQKSDIKSKQEAMRKLLKEKKDVMKNKLPTPATTN